MNAWAELHDEAAVEAVRRRLRLDPYHLRRLRHALLQAARDDESALAELPRHQRDEFRMAVRLHALRPTDRSASTLDGSTKLVFETRAGARLESVVLGTPTGRTTLCVSSQVGCRAQCRFCATGAMPSVVHLTTSEILDQLVQVEQQLRPAGGGVRNLVFMGMGEPLHNEANVHGALRALESSAHFAWSLQRVIVSTVGVPDAMVRLATTFPRVRLALSLHQADQEQRERLIPLARRHTLADLRDAALEVVASQRRPLLIQYLLLEGVNDRDEDLERLLTWLQGLDCHLNLIPFNPAPGLPAWRPTERVRRDAFAAKLRQAGYLTTIRYSQGADIEAACGQLAGGGVRSEEGVRSGE